MIASAMNRPSHGEGTTEDDRLARFKQAVQKNGLATVHFRGVGGVASRNRNAAWSLDIFWQ